MFTSPFITSYADSTRSRVNLFSHAYRGLQNFIRLKLSRFWFATYASRTCKRSIYALYYQPKNPEPINVQCSIIVSMLIKFPNINKLEETFHFCQLLRRKDTTLEREKSTRM